VRIAVKIVISLAVILLATELGRRMPSLGGLVAVMPLTGLLVLVWVHLENRDNPAVLVDYTRGALWGIVPTVFFYLAVMVCLVKRLPLPASVSVGFGVWVLAAVVHQWLL